MPSTKTIVEVIYTAKNDENKDGIADEDQRRVQYVDYDGTILYNNLNALSLIADLFIFYPFFLHFIYNSFILYDWKFTRRR